MKTPRNAAGTWSTEQRGIAMLRARQVISRGIDDIVEGSHGREAFVEEPAFTGAQTMMRRPVAELAMVAAIVLCDRAIVEAHNQICKARAEGASWEYIAEVVGLTDRDGAGHSPAEQAFYLVVPETPGSFEPSSTSWRCGSCGRLVEDRGPFNSHPVDNESGHAEECARLAAEVEQYWRDEVAQYRRESGEDA